MQKRYFLHYQPAILTDCRNPVHIHCVNKARWHRPLRVTVMHAYQLLVSPLGGLCYSPLTKTREEKPMKTSVRLATLALLFPATAAFAAEPVADRIAKVESGLMPRTAIKGKPLPTSTLANRMATLKVPGVSIAVINNGAIEWARGYGVADAATKRPVTPDTLFQAASISKPVAALGALHLAEKGKIALDEDVNLKLTGWKVPSGAQTAAAPVTMRALLNHSAGTTVHGFRGYAEGEPVPTLVQLLDGTKPANSAPVRVAVEPGDSWKYSGGGISIAQLLMTSASGKPFASLMQDTVLTPLGMKHSTFEQPLPPSLHAVAASGHDQMGEPIKGKWHTYPEQAAAGLWTTPTDLARFAIELQQASAGKSNKVISKAMATAMLTRLKGSYGLGIAVDKVENLTTFSHSGANAGFRTMMFAFTTTGQGAVVMTNGDRGDGLGSEIFRSIAAAYGWKDWRVTEKAVASVDPKTYAGYVGTFQADKVNVIVTQEGERLFVAAPALSAERRELFPSSATTFFTLYDGTEFAFEKDEAGKFDLVVKARQTMKAKRIL